MKPGQQRIKIAEACGWKVHPKDRFIVIPPNSPHSVQPLSTIPNYLNDLNAMHEAEKVLTDEQLEEYFTRIHKNFSASQRAEAFLRTFNLWKP